MLLKKKVLLTPGLSLLVISLLSLLLAACGDSTATSQVPGTGVTPPTTGCVPIPGIIACPTHTTPASTPTTPVSTTPQATASAPTTTPPATKSENGIALKLRYSTPPLPGHGDTVNSVAYSPDGKTLASASNDYTIKLWEVATGKEIKTLGGHTLSVLGVAYSPDGKTLASVSDDGTAKLWDTSSGAEIRTFKSAFKYFEALAFSPDGKALALTGASSGTLIYDVATGQEKYNEQYGGQTVSFSPDGKHLIVNERFDAVIRDAGSGQELKRLSASNHEHLLKVNGDGKTLIAVSEEGVHFWDLSSGAEKTNIEKPAGKYTAGALSPDGKTLALGTINGDTILIDAETGKQLKSTFESGWIESLAFSPGGETLAVAGQDESIRLWKVSTAKDTTLLKGHKFRLNAVTFSPDGKALAISNGDPSASLKVIEADRGSEINTFKYAGPNPNAIAYSPDGKYLAIDGANKEIILLDPWTGKELAGLKGQIDLIKSLAFSPDGKFLASGGWDGKLELWDVTAQKLLFPLNGPKGDINNVAFSPDGKYLASCSDDNTTIIWDVVSGKALNTLTGQSAAISSLAFSPDSKILATGTWPSSSPEVEGVITLWDVVTGKKVATLQSHSRGINGLGFTPDGKFLISSSFDATIMAWDIASGRMLFSTTPKETTFVTGLAISPDGKSIASSHLDGSVKVWDISFN